MITSQAIINSAYSKCSQALNILYEPTNHLFDYLMKGVRGQLFYLNKYENYYHDMIIYHNVNNPELQQKIRNEQLKSLLMIHTAPNPTIKKEDVFIFKQNISNINKIIFEDSVAKRWGFSSDDGHVMNYGIPKIELPKEKNIPVLILNFDNNPQIDNLYKHIQAHIPNCAIIKNTNNQNYWDDIISIISDSRIVIDITQKFNILFALGCGCQTISTFNEINSEFNHSINDFNQIIPMINDIINKPTNYSEISESTISKYPYAKFIDTLNTITSQIKLEEVFYV
jgi:hypothetical protein